MSRFSNLFTKSSRRGNMPKKWYSYKSGSKFNEKKIKSNRKMKTQSGFIDCDNCGAWNSAYKTEHKSSLNLCVDCLEGTHVL